MNTETSAADGVTRGSALGPLAGLRILDLGTMMAGPVAATLLADFGAEVIKVEMPRLGDPLRQIAPFVNGDSLYWNVDGRNKKSVTIDLHHPDGQALLRRLAAQVDAVVENFRPGVLDGWNVGYRALSAQNEQLVMLSTSGFGQTGPYAQRAGYDRMGMAFGGLMNLCGYPDRPPVRPGVSMADYTTAVMGAFSLMMTLYHRDAMRGPGQHIDLSLYETVFRFTEILTAEYDKFGVVRERRGNLHFLGAPGDHFQTQDGRYLILTLSSDQGFRRLCAAMERADLAQDPRYRTHASRWERIGELNDVIATWIAGKPVEAVIKRLDEHKLAYSLIYNIADIVADPHYAARESIASVHTPRAGDVKMPAVVPKLSRTPPGPIQPAPALGEHNREVFIGLVGLTSEEFADYVAREVI